MIDPRYPRPQFVRNSWMSLDGSWEYSFSERKNPCNVSWQGEICVPFPPESPLSGVQGHTTNPVVWYRRTFRLPENWDGARILLHFGAVDYLAQVWVNGQLVVEHEGGHTPFQADVTDALLPGTEQTVTVRAADEPKDLEKPRGKQDWEPEPHSIWYPRTTGIWQPVWLEPVASDSIGRLHLTPDVARFAIDITTDIDHCCDDSLPAGLTLEVAASRNGEELVAERWAVDSGRVAGTLALPAPAGEAERKALLWSPENPILFDLTLTLTLGDEILDRVESYTGLRSVEARNGRFYLNGEPYFLQMVLDQGYWAESLLAAPNPEALRRDVALTKALGFNGARKHQKIEDPRYFYWADHLGLLVWDELPSAYKFSPTAARRLTSEFMAMIERDYNHPCVVAWVPFNESWGIPDVKGSAPQRHLAQTLYHMGKALDPTRLVIDNDGWEHFCTDLFTIHDYENQPEVFARRYGSDECLTARINHGKTLALEGFSPEGLPVILSEFGGMRLGSGKGWGYQTVQSPDEFLKVFAPLMKSVYSQKLTGYCYTQLTDTFQEQNGLLNMDRSPKVDPAVVRQILIEGRQGWQQ